jgi:pilin isopeptide linkage protein
MKNIKAVRGNWGTKLLNSMLAIVLVIGLSPISKAAATQSGSSSQEVEQSQDVGNAESAAAENEGSAAVAASENAADAKVAAEAAKADASSSEASKPEATNADATKAAEPATTAEPAAESNDASNEPAAQANDGIMLAADSGTSEYNPNADPVEVTSASGTVNANISYDAEGSHPYDNQPITANDELYASINIVFNQNSKPTLAQPNVSYTLPDSISVKSQASQNLYDSNNLLAGTWSISNNQVILKFSDTWLNAHASEVTAFFKIQFSIADKNAGDGDSTSFVFPGTTSTVTIPAKDGGVSGSKSADNNGAYDAATGTYSWTIQVTPATAAHNLVVSDTLGSNLTFDSSSVTYTDKNGNAISGATCSIDGQNVTFNLGNLTAGDYYIKYSTKVNQSAISSLKDNTEISDVDNKCKWSWGTTTPQSSSEVTASPSKVKYSMVSKSADGSSTPEKIKWTVTLNNGSLLANMNGYQFSDNAGSNQQFLTSEGVTITGADGSAITPSSQSFTDSGLSFTLPSTVGQQKVTVTYYTKMTDTSSKDDVKNTATVTPGTESEGPEGTGTGSYTPPDDEIGITKTLTSTIDPYNYTGTANWSSVIDFSSMASNTTASSIKFTDQFSSTPEPWDCVTVTPSSVGVTAKTDAGVVALESGVDYTLTTKDAQNRLNDFITIKFMDTDKVKSLIGASGAKVTIVYTTTTTPKDGTYVAGTYTNKSTVVTNNAKNGKSATASFEIKEKTTAPAVQKSVASNATWDASYEWSDGTKGAWIVGWTAKVNQKDGQAVMDLNDQDVTLTDILPANTEVVANSATYKVMEKAGYNGSKDISVTPTVADGKATFTAVTKGAEYSWGGALPTPVSVVFSYKTATKNIEVGASVTLSNSATAQSGTTEFPKGTASTTIDNSVLSKSAGNGTDEAHVKYTIDVNPNAQDLVDGDVLVLEDTMSATLSYTAGSLKVTDGSGNDVTSSCSISVANVKDESGNEDTLLTISVPDATKLTITYECMPLGYIGQQVTISNDVKLHGQDSSVKGVSRAWSVAKSTAGADAVSYGLTVTKTDQADSSKLLKGAEFTLSEVDLSTGAKTSTVGSLTTGDAGAVTFGTKATPLEASKLYYVEETKAPAGYEVSYDGTYVLFYPATATSQAVTDFEAAYEAAVKLGHTPVVGTVSDATSTGPGITLSVYDKKTTSTSATLGVTKTVNGGSANIADGESFDFKLYSVDEQGAETEVSSATCTKDAPTASFDAQTYTAAGTYNYKVKETSTLGSGWTKASDQDVTVTVVADADGNLSVESVTYGEAKTAITPSTTGEYDLVMNNTFATSCNADIKVSKTVVGGTSQTADETFDFDLYKADGYGVGADGKVTGEKVASVTGVKAGGTASFDAQSFTKAGTYNYVVHEVGHNTDGWTAAADVNATVTVAKGTDGNLTASVKYGTSDTDTAAKFQNTYASTGTATINVYKTVNGGTTAKPGETFEFQLIDEDNITVDTVKTKAGEVAPFTAIAYDSADAGKTFTYTIHEIGHNTDGWTAAADVTAKVTVTDDGKGHLTTAVEYNNATDDKAAAAFDNKYSATGTATINVSKTVVGGTEAVKGETFDFQLFKADENGNKTGDAIDSITGVTDGSTKAFKSIEYTTADAGKTFNYVVHEDATKLGSNWSASGDVNVTVTVTENADLSLGTSVKYGDSDTATAAAFTNTYTTSGNATISVYKTVNGGTTAKPNETFTFQLFKADENGNKTGDVIDTVTTKAGEKKAFDSSKVQISGEGVTKFVIHEEGHNTDGWTAASDVTATVTATDTKDGLTTSVEYSKATDDKTAAAFNNLYQATGAATISVNKVVNGGTEAVEGESFEFQLTDEEGLQVDTASAKAGETVSFAAVEYDFDDAGKTFAYTIHEIGHNTDGWTADADVKATVKVSDKGDGTLSTEVSYDRATDDKTAAKFVNEYSTSGKATISVYKTVNGGTTAKPNETFEFQLIGPDNEVGYTVTTKAGEVKSFEDLEFDSEDAGKTYEYTIHEVGHNTDGWTAAADVKATVTISDDGKGHLTTAVEYSNATDDKMAAAFNNEYTATGTATISVNKVVNGGTEAAEGEAFDFELIDPDGDSVDTVSAKAGETVSFIQPQYDFEDAGQTYVYTIHEVGHNTEGWFAASDVTATVTIVDNGNGTLGTTVVYSNGTNAAEFNNIKSTATGKIEIKKTVNGGAAQPDEHFTFELKPQGDAPAAEKSTADTFGGDTCDFGNIEFTKEGTYTYVIHETSQLGDGWTNDEDITVTVTVVRDEENKCLKVESIDYGNRAYEQNGVKMAHFDNKYVAPEQPVEEEKAEEQTTEQKSYGVKTGDYLGGMMAFAFGAIVVAGGVALASARRLRRSK